MSNMVNKETVTKQQMCQNKPIGTDEAKKQKITIIFFFSVTWNIFLYGSLL